MTLTCAASPGVLTCPVGVPSPLFAFWLQTSTTLQSIVLVHGVPLRRSGIAFGALATVCTPRPAPCAHGKRLQSGPVRNNECHRTTCPNSKMTKRMSGVPAQSHWLQGLQVGSLEKVRMQIPVVSLLRASRVGSDGGQQNTANTGCSDGSTREGCDLLVEQRRLALTMSTPPSGTETPR